MVSNPELEIAISCKIGDEVAVIVAEHFVVPPAPAKVPIYVVVWTGETVFEPLGATAPMPLSMLVDVAFAEVQVRVAGWPSVIVVGDAERAQVGAGIFAMTVTVAEHTAVPPAPVTVSVYVVVWVGFTDFEPLVPVPTLGILPDVAFCEAHVKVTGCPAVTEVGEAVMVQVGGVAYPFGNGEPGNGVADVRYHCTVRPIVPFAVFGSA